MPSMRLLEHVLPLIVLPWPAMMPCSPLSFKLHAVTVLAGPTAMPEFVLKRDTQCNTIVRPIVAMPPPRLYSALHSTILRPSTPPPVIPDAVFCTARQRRMFEPVPAAMPWLPLPLETQSSISTSLLVAIPTSPLPPAMHLRM